MNIKNKLGYDRNPTTHQIYSITAFLKNRDTILFF